MIDSPLSRRQLLGTAAFAGAAALLPRDLAAQAATPAAASAVDGFVLVTSANGLEAAKTARQALIQGKEPLEAAIAGVNVVELDPDDVTVGYGGIPNEEGVVELDAAVMDGKTMRAGAVAALTGVKTPSKVARLVMDRTDRVFLVGAGARRFATVHGFPDEELLTEKTRKIWLHWKNRLSDLDDWIEAARDAEDPDVKRFLEKYGRELFRPQGTIHMSVRSARGDLAGVTTTSGLFFKIPARRRLPRRRRRPLFRERSRFRRFDRAGRGESRDLRLAYGRRVPPRRTRPRGGVPQGPEADRRKDPPRPAAPRREGAPEVQRELLLRRRGRAHRRRSPLERREVRRRRYRRRPIARERLALQERRLSVPLPTFARTTDPRRDPTRLRGDR
ncbi:MAG: isoaspartyl peptidase/L-asparaginase [Holophagales bacterium]|nr:isoaspartyl peptidase/L-asparaginase [Holophagales bacterium]